MGNSPDLRRADLVLAVLLGAVTAGLAVTGAMAAWYGVAAAAATGALLLWAPLCWPRSRGRLGRPLLLAAALSLAGTVFKEPPDSGAGSWPQLLAVALLLVLLVPVVRWSPRHEAVTAGAVTALAVAAWSLPLLPDPSVLSLAGAAAFWTLPVLGAAVVGGYPRLMEHRRERLVADSRREQRLRLARDLHDFVAHDISGIVAQAQAARFVAASDPGQAGPALERIERAGLNALAAMDRMVRMLGEPDDGREAEGVEPLPGVSQLLSLVERFTADGGPEARLRMDAALASRLSHDTGSTAYRMVVEALTNVRRHAPGAPFVAVSLTEARTPAGDGAVEVRVVNGPSPAGGTGLRLERYGPGGQGLAGMRERVQATGGTLDFGAYQGGWRVAAVLPLAPVPAGRAS
ncbi:sensor histidine kinase [Streptomyces orinoci]|uniref:histidine kinase n=1 Tax=Streptomyces orinoci TaxID=67339 RepID=A0ABV3JWB4_STRON|nr:histidine kinase [Streptomyces orinoci]